MFPGYDSEMVKRFKKTGLIALGKTNTPEFGLMGINRAGIVRPDAQSGGISSTLPADQAEAPPPRWLPAWCLWLLEEMVEVRSAFHHLFARCLA